MEFPGLTEFFFSLSTQNSDFWTTGAGVYLKQSCEQTSISLQGMTIDWFIAIGTKHLFNLLNKIHGHILYKASLLQ